MTKTEERIAKLEGKVRGLSIVVVLLSTLFCYSVMSGNLTIAGKGVAAKVVPPEAIEAQAFVLKDKNGNIRGMWSAEDLTSTFAIAYKEKYPSIVMSVSEKAATINVSDRLQNQVAIGVNDKQRSIIVGNKNWQTLVGLISTNKEARVELSSQLVKRILSTDMPAPAEKKETQGK